MARATDTEIRKIIDLDEDVTDLTPFISAANMLVTAKCEGSGYSEAELTVIENWLAAHFAAMKDPRYSSETAGVSVSYQTKIDDFLKLTHFGQQVLVLDYAGNLSALNKKTAAGGRSVGVTWLGTDLSE